MRGMRLLVVGIMLVLALSVPKQVIADPEQTANAVQAAQAWLTVIDQGKYAQSWDLAAGYFQQSVTKEQWQQALSAVRTPLGPKASRTLKSKTYLTALPGAPDGHYVVIQFATSFANKKSAIETITPMRQPNGQWRVSGYYIK